MSREVTLIDDQVHNCAEDFLRHDLALRSTKDRGVGENIEQSVTSYRYPYWVVQNTIREIRDACSRSDVVAASNS